MIGPSNPVISIGPILAVPGIRAALAAAPAPVVAVSPLVAGAVVKGPTEPFLRWAGQPLSSDGIAALYHGVVDGLVADQEAEHGSGPPDGRADGDAGGRRRVAQETLAFACRWADSVRARCGRSQSSL